MIYVTSDIHGNYQKLKALFEEINFTDDDIMYVLGDLVDYGDESMEVICDLSVRMNVYPILGEHDAMARRFLSGFEKMLKNKSKPSDSFVSGMQAWVKDGGQKTLDCFRALDDDMKEGVIDYLSDMPAYEIAVTEKGDKFLLVHAGIDKFSPENEIEDYKEKAFYSVPIDINKEYFKNAYLVVGHVPTTELGEKNGKIIYRGKNIAIDGGVCRGGSLACLRLDDFKEFYV